ncbi:phosphoadenosine phosphosulfate reductase [Sporosarcina sp. P37]|uniref:phosphoadenylyl-sulfate reductase n=1 Tax=unclassified Sporosarcina TaxID=2647733 RepID=UPI0009C01586|nr:MULTISPECIES: phosphoadenylyl-sulfate reductase [unclassified Sporosarcina]ARD47719.1 phosphoadenosine phosphosulfate reductase [Sporosarcina sp. P33]ARK24251.1 phosphoadenosine phosphosulfate reductase [Sporosarcina sp. P37]PID18473.1 phosphoadenylyl-sulfate reductase [Sporosarcina sp. P35]
MVTFESWNETAVLPVFPADSETKGAAEVLQWAYSHYGEKLVYACSFGIEGIVLIELISRIKADAKIIFLDTNYHFKETYETIEKVKKRYPQLHIHMQQPRLTIEQQTEQYGLELWKNNPNLCCDLRKIKPLEEAISPSAAWISGLRREQSETRKTTEFLNLDQRFKKIKVCPLIHWTWKDVWRFAHKHELDYNVLHDQGFPSIGCATCTKPAFTEEDMRSGRWTGSGKTECGLHT